MENIKDFFAEHAPLISVAGTILVAIAVGILSYQKGMNDMARVIIRNAGHVN